MYTLYFNNKQKNYRKMDNFANKNKHVQMDHLACFAGGMYGLAAHQEKDGNSDRWMKIAEEILLFYFFR